MALTDRRTGGATACAEAAGQVVPRPPTGAATNREKQRRGITTQACPRMRARAAGGSRRPAAVRAVTIAAADGSHLFQIRTPASCDPSLHGEFSDPEPFGSV
ncbi:hypothetical protein ACIRS3_14435 [Streptomyces virginiae]|uniref:hypothetical protein n=1 Tax=Streptomyces virginiae TaxID=1961 RepID=UPI00381965B2